MSDFPCCVEYAKSNRSQCKACSRAIPKGAVRIGQQYDRDHSGYLWYHVACFRKFPKDGSTTAESFLFGFEQLSSADKAKVENAFRGTAAVSTKTAAAPAKKWRKPDSEEESTEEDNEEEGDDEEEEEEVKIKKSTPTASRIQIHHTQLQPQAFHFPRSQMMPMSSVSPTMVPGLSLAVAAAGLSSAPFFAHPPPPSLRALRCAMEAFGIDNDRDALTETLQLIQKHFS